MKVLLTLQSLLFFFLFKLWYVAWKSGSQFILSHFSTFATFITLLKWDNFGLFWGEEKWGKWKVKTKEQNMDLNFFFGSALFWLEIESNSVFALHLLILCKPSMGFLIPFLGMDFGMLGLKSYLYQMSRSYSLPKIPFGACGVTMADGTID